MTDIECAEITAAINTGSVYKLPKDKLEQYLSSLSSPNAYAYFSTHQYENYKNVVSLAITNLSHHESTSKITHTINKQQQWWNKPVVLIAIGAAGTLLAMCVAWVVAHYLGLNLQNIK